MVKFYTVKHPYEPVIRELSKVKCIHKGPWECPGFSFKVSEVRNSSNVHRGSLTAWRG